MVTARFIRGDGGKFGAKGDEERKVRSLRATDSVWESFGEAAEERGITRADLLESLVEDEVISSDGHPASVVDDEILDEVVELLQDALSLKSNAGGAIKAKIREVLELLGADTEP
jgi:hypothetical protein